jgi:hypothetical protein
MNFISEILKKDNLGNKFKYNSVRILGDFCNLVTKILIFKSFYSCSAKFENKRKIGVAVSPLMHSVPRIRV